jgi:hypothetical protein
MSPKCVVVVEGPGAIRTLELFVARVDAHMQLQRRPLAKRAAALSTTVRPPWPPMRSEMAVQKLLCTK